MCILGLFNHVFQQQWANSAEKNEVEHQRLFSKDLKRGRPKPISVSYTNRILGRLTKACNYQTAVHYSCQGLK